MGKSLGWEIIHQDERRAWIGACYWSVCGCAAFSQRFWGQATAAITAIQNIWTEDKAKRIISRCIYQGKGKHNMQRHGFKNSWISTALVNHKKHKSNSKTTERPMFRYLREDNVTEIPSQTLEALYHLGALLEALEGPVYQWVFLWMCHGFCEGVPLPSVQEISTFIFLFNIIFIFILIFLPSCQPLSKRKGYSWRYPGLLEVF